MSSETDFLQRQTEDTKESGTKENRARMQHSVADVLRGEISAVGVRGQVERKEAE